MRRRHTVLFLAAALALAAVPWTALGAGDAAKELATLEEKFETTALSWKESYDAFRPEYEKLAKEHPGTEEALTAKLRMLQFVGGIQDKQVQQAEAARRVDEILAEYPRSPQLDRLPDVHYLFSKEKYADVIAKLSEPDQPDAVRARMALLRAESAVRSGDAAKAKADLEALETTFKDLPRKWTTYGALADAIRNPHPKEALEVGQPAPEIVGKDVDGKELRLSALKGRVVVLDFFGDW